MWSTIGLIAQTPDAHGRFASVSETEKTVFCEVRSVTRMEYYSAKSAGLEPEYIFFITNEADYSKERIVKYDNVRYKVIRTYNTDGGVELTCSREAVE